MIISMSWLKNHLSTKANIKQVIERLTEIGLEVESVKSPASDFDNFIICKVVKSQKHYSNFSGRLEIQEAFLE